MLYVTSKKQKLIEIITTESTRREMEGHLIRILNQTREGDYLTVTVENKDSETVKHFYPIRYLSG